MMVQSGVSQRLSEYLTVGEAAELLGVSPWTLRNWDKAGKLRPIRHPKSGYRIYRHEDLRAVLEPDDVGRQGKEAPNRLPRTDWTTIAESEHFVQFYESDSFMMDAVGGYIGTGLERGEAAIVIATPPHRSGITRRMRAAGLDLATARTCGQYVCLDAAQTLAQFMVDGSPDPARFMDVVGGVVERASRGRRRIRAFGEMVALLWAEGNRAAAIRLEELWNDLAKAHRFALFCAYPMDGFAGETHGQPFGDVCACHTRVIPAESYAALSTPNQRLREIALLQQKARSLEAEIEQRCQVEEQLRAANAAAEQASKAKDQFLAVLSHELRTPLTPVLLSIAAMESEPGLPPRMREDLAMIRRNIALETRFIDDLLDLSRVVNGKMVLHKQDVDVHPLIRNVVEMLAADAQAKRLELDVNLGAPHQRVHADSARLHQVLWNLLKNAIKFTPEGGRIGVLTRNPAAERLVIEVRDTGIGIEPAALPAIFNAFDQGEQGLNRAFGGLGLGLAIAKTVVELHEGTIRAQSPGLGQGACFTVELMTTCAAAPAATGPVRRPAVDAAGGHYVPLRILLVDDHLDTIRMMRRLLELSGHSVTAASSVIEAIRAAEAHEFDLLISDIGLPDGTGLDVVRQVRLRYPDLPAIALTGYGMEQDVRNSELAGFTEHLTKPVDVQALRDAIGRLGRGVVG